MNVGVILVADVVREMDHDGPGSLPPDMTVVEVDVAPEGYARARLHYFDGSEHRETVLPCADLVPVNRQEEALKIAESSGEQIARHFGFRHLPPRQAMVSRVFARLAGELVEALPRSAERTVALRKLLESKDAALRALP